MTDAEIRRPVLPFICLVLFLDSVGLSLIIPVLPDLIGEMSVLSNSDSAQIAGYLLLTFASVQFLFAPIIGGLSDRYGRRPILLMALLGFGFSHFIMAGAHSLWVLFLARALSGVFGATQSAALASISDTSSADDRTRKFGLAGASIGLGFVVGPAIGGVLGELGTRLPFIVAGVVSIVAFGYGWFALPETLAKANRRAFELVRANPLGSLLSVRRSGISLFIVAMLLLQLANQSFITIWSFFTIEVVGWSPLNIGLSVGLYGVMMVVVQGWLTGPLVQRFGAITVVCVGLAIGIFAALGTANVSTSWHIYFWILVGGFGTVVIPAMQALMTRNVPENMQGELQGAVGSAYSLAAIFGPLLMAHLFSTYTQGDGPYFPGAPFIGSAILLCVCLSTFATAARRLRLKSLQSP